MCALETLSSPLLIFDEAVYEIILRALAPGRYPFICLPHYAAGMVGSLLVTENGGH